MSKETEEIRFCTCTDENALPEWKLTRKGKYMSTPTKAVGKVVTNGKEQENNLFLSKILTKLQENAIFDMPDFAPQEGDYLEIPKLAILAFEKGKWVVKSRYDMFGKKVVVITNSGSEVFQGKISTSHEDQL